MRRLVLMLLMTILISSCENKTDVKKETVPTSTHVFENCAIIGNGVSRCENSEAICYVYKSYNRGGLSCYFKEKLKIKDRQDATIDAFTNN